MTFFDSTATTHPGEFRARLRRRVQRGFTLVEVMIATMVFTMGILGVYAMMIKSYELVTLSRHRDNARAFLLSFSDQFLRLQTTDMVGGVPVLRPLFATAGTGGDGLSWTDTAGNVVTGNLTGAAPVMSGQSSTGQTTPPALGGTMASINANTWPYLPYAYTS